MTSSLIDFLKINQRYIDPLIDFNVRESIKNNQKRDFLDIHMNKFIKQLPDKKFTKSDRTKFTNYIIKHSKNISTNTAKIIYYYLIKEYSDKINDVTSINVCDKKISIDLTKLTTIQLFQIENIIKENSNVLQF